MVADDQDSPFDPGPPRRAIGSQDVDIEVVVPGERDGFRVERDCLARCDVPAHDGLGAVVDDRHRHPAEVRERLAVAVEEAC